MSGKPPNGELGRPAWIIPIGRRVREGRTATEGERAKIIPFGHMRRQLVTQGEMKVLSIKYNAMRAAQQEFLGMHQDILERLKGGAVLEADRPSSRSKKFRTRNQVRRS